MPRTPTTKTSLVEAWSLAIRAHRADPNLNTYEYSRKMARFYVTWTATCFVLATFAFALWLLEA